MPKQIIFGSIRALHDLFTAMWIGGLLTTGLTFMPVFKKSRNKIKGLVALLDGYQKKLANYVLISIVGLWITGLFLRSTMMMAQLWPASTVIPPSESGLIQPQALMLLHLIVCFVMARLQY